MSAKIDVSALIIAEEVTTAEGLRDTTKSNLREVNTAFHPVRTNLFQPSAKGIEVIL